MISQLMTGTAHEGGKKCGWEGIEVSLDQPQGLKGDGVWPLKRGARGGIRSD